MKKFTFWRLLALILALVTVLGCMAGCEIAPAQEEQTEEKTEPSESTAPSTEPETPTKPEEPEVPTEAETPTEPEEPEVPTEPEIPTKPEEPEVPTEPEIPTEPEVPTVTEAPEAPTVTEAPEVPDEPETPAIPELTEERAWELFDQPSTWLGYFKRYGQVNYEDSYEHYILGDYVSYYAVHGIETTEDMYEAICALYSRKHAQWIMDNLSEYDVVWNEGTMYFAPLIGRGEAGYDRDTLEMEKVAEGEYVISAMSQFGERIEEQVIYEDGDYKIK